MCELCLNDPTGLQPARLFHCVQFMMFDREFTGSISVDGPPRRALPRRRQARRSG